MTSEDQIILKARERFIEELPLQLEAIQIELSKFKHSPTEAHQSLCSILHQLKGGAGFFGFTELVSEIRNFELLYKDSPPGDLFKEHDGLAPIIVILKALINTES
jgi:chemotaxis protein histidine kinase CheA